MSKATYPRTVELPEHLIDLFAEHGDDLISALTRIISEAGHVQKIRHA